MFRPDQQQMIRYLVDQGIVVNDVLNEKKTEELKQSATRSSSASDDLPRRNHCS